MHGGGGPGPGGPKMRDGKGGLSLNLGAGDMSQAYYFQQQQQQSGLGGMYGGPPSPLQMLHPPMSPLSPGPPLPSHGLGQPIYMSSMPPPPDYGGGNGGQNKRGMNGSNRGRKSVPFPLDIPSMGSIGGGDQSPNWFGSMHGGLGSIHMPPYLQSPVSHHMQQQHMNLALMSPSSQTSTQSSHSHQLRPPPRHQGPLSLHSPNASYSGGSVTLTVHNLHPQADAALLHELFAPYGKIISAQVETDRGGGRGGGSGQCTGRGRVQMAGFAQAEYAAQGK